MQFVLIGGLVVEEKYLRVANYARNVNREIDMIAHSCGCRHARGLEKGGGGERRLDR